MKFSLPETAQSIWTAESVPNQSVALRREFTLDAASNSARLLISADTDFILWCNGIEAGRGQYSDFPDGKSFSIIALPQLRAGRNLIAILAYHAGEEFFSTVATPAGIIAALVDDTGQRLISDPAWRAVEHSGWRSGLLPRRSIQTCFTSQFDARNFPKNWMMPGYDDHHWPHAVTSAMPRPVIERPIPPCRLGEFRRGTPVKTGTFRKGPAQPDDSFARQMKQCEYHPAARMPETTGTDDGIFAIFDLGREEAGFISIALSAPAGSIVDCAHGEHLDDGMVRMAIGERNFADRCICQEGVTDYELSFHRVGARYLQLNVTPARPGQVILHRVGIRPWNYPLPEAAEFTSDDPLASQLRATAQRTLELCLHEHYEDCPWREQALFSYDARNQALYGYHLWGNYDFARASFALLAHSHSWRNDHWMMLCAPMKYPTTIPIFSLIWLMAAWENYLYSGDRSLFDRFAPMAEDLIRHALARRDQATGLYHTGTEAELWNFYECTPGLDTYGCRPDEFHAGYNLYLIEALDAYSRLLDEGPEGPYRRIAAELRQAVDAAFRDEAHGAYAGRLIGGIRQPEFHDHIQYVALQTGSVPASWRDRVIETLRSGTLHPAVLNALPYLVNALMPHSPVARSHVAGHLRATYSAMLKQETGTFWETGLGADDFAGAGSLCHAWSSLPVYYQSAVLLGVTPLEPGFRRFRVQPYADAWTTQASGSVPTPHGPIRVSWKREVDGLKLNVEHPAGLICEIASYPECPVATCKLSSLREDEPQAYCQSPEAGRSSLESSKIRRFSAPGFNLTRRTPTS